MEIVSDLDYDFCSCVDISVNQILKNLVTWCSDTVIVLGGRVKMTMNCRQPHKSGQLVQWHCDCLFWESQMTEHNQNPTKYIGPWCSDTSIIFLGFSNDWAFLSIQIFEISMSFEYGLDAGFFEWCQKFFLLDKRLFYNVSLQLMIFY